MSESPNVHLKGLNGIRAIAALSVVITHIVQSLGSFGEKRMHGLDLANFGVTMFFTLSGFLITYLLLLEKQKFSDINVKQFYIRRVLRIWPLYYFYLLISVITLFLYQPEIFSEGQLFFYVFFCANVPFITGHTMPIIGHFWSIGVEEQFYLFWPWVVKKVNTIFKWVVAFVIVFFGLKILFWIFYTKTGNPIPLNTVHITRVHCMAIGAIGAILFYNRDEKFLKLSFSLFTQIIVWAVIGLAAINKFNIASLINDEIISVITVFLIVNVSSNPKTIIKLDNWYMNYLGKISYGIYVYHPLLIFLTAKWLGQFIKTIEGAWRYAVIYIIIMLSTIIAASLSYELLEKRFLKFKDKFSRIKSSSIRMAAVSNN